MIKAGMVVLYKDSYKREVERLGVVSVSYTIQRKSIIRSIKSWNR